MVAKKRVGFHLSPELYKKLRLLAAEKGVSMRALVLAALEQAYQMKEVACEK